MPPGIRIRSNNVFGTVADNPLTPASTVFNSNQLVLLPQVAGDHAVITLDPIRQFGDPEIVIVTAHAAAATVATITRGAYGTSAREHPFETVWTHAAVDEDWIEIVGNPSIDILEPYRNQLAWDSNDSLQRFDGSNWNLFSPLGSLGYAEVTAAQGGITTQTDLTGLTVTVDVPDGHRIKITGFCALRSDTVGDRAQLQIREGAATLASATVQIAIANIGTAATAHRVLTPSAGLHTYKLSAQRFGSGTVTMDALAASPAFILVEDIG